MTDIREFVMSEPLFETHNHQRGFSEHDWETKTWRELLGYADSDVHVAAGAAAPANLDDEARFFDLWPFVRTTGYGRAVELTSRALFGLEFTRENAAAITEAVRAFGRGRTPEAAAQDAFARARIQWSINDIFWRPGNDLAIFDGHDHLGLSRFTMRYRFASHASLWTREEIQKLESATGVAILSLHDMETAFERWTDAGTAGGRVVAFKIPTAYDRHLDFEEVSPHDAERCLSSILLGRETDPRPLTDFLAHRVVRRAGERSLPVQIHTGYLAGVGGDLRRGDPTPLVSLFRRYPEVRFDIFHAAWPWSEFIGAAAKAFPNVWVDLCWAWSMSPASMERILEEWLGQVPSNKILGFGSDTLSPLPVVGYALQAREGIARVLEKMVAQGDLKAPEARFVAQRLLHENARDLFGQW